MTTTTKRGFHPVAAVTERVQAVVPAGAAWPLAVAAAVLTIASTFLAWTWTTRFPGNLTVYGYPGGNQIYTLLLGLFALLFLGAMRGPGWLRAIAPAGAVRGVRAMAGGAFVATAYTVVAIMWELGGLVNLEPGAWVALVASLLLLLAALALPDDSKVAAPVRRRAAVVEILVIVAALLVTMLVIAYGLATESEQAFLGYLIAVGFGALALSRVGMFAALSVITSRYRAITAISAFAVAFMFPFTQTSDAYTSIAANILVFATVALGLNIVVGLAGLLDLGYVAFLGVGAYVGALVSGSAFSPFDIDLPFPLAALLGAGVAALFGVLIGAPTLRLRGDYLAIVTLGFGEIFRITANNLDGNSGPLITRGPNGIPAVPELELFGFNFGETHTILGVQFGKFANYYLLMLLLMAFVVLIFARVNDSRVGRAWVAIREDEIAASAMGINTFNLKLVAFALGACLAGLAGTVQAHVTTTVTPDQYVFLQSAFLLAAVVLGGMGTIVGPLLGSTLLLLIPEKLRFFAEYRLFLFGLALVLIMRFRPEGLVPSTRRQLEFHDHTPSEGDALGPGPAVLAKEGRGI